MNSTEVHVWSARPAVPSRVLPQTGGDTWDPESCAPARFTASLKALQVKDPTRRGGRSATAHYEAALTHRAYENEMGAKLPVAPSAADIADRLGAGAITREEAEKELAKVPSPAIAAEHEARRRELMQAATRNAYRDAVYAIHFYGEDKWLAFLRPHIQAAVDARDDVRFAALHRLAALLRSRELGALESLVVDPAGMIETDEVWRFAIGRPDRYHGWRDERAEALHVAGYEHIGTTTVIATVVLRGPSPDLQAMIDGGMEPRLYSAAEAVAIKDRVLAEQEAGLMSAAAVMTS